MAKMRRSLLLTSSSSPYLRKGRSATSNTTFYSYNSYLQISSSSAFSLSSSSTDLATADSSSSCGCDDSSHNNIHATNTIHHYHNNRRPVFVHRPKRRLTNVVNSDDDDESGFCIKKSSRRYIHIDSFTTNKSVGNQSDSSSTSSISSTTTTTTTTTTELVDSLLERTRELMNGHKRHYVAFSGGVDSSLVAALVYMCSQTNNKINNNNNTDDNNDELIVCAILGISPAVSTSQIQLAEDVATHIGIPFEQIYTTEGTDPTYIKNNGMACYACKTHLYTCMTSIMKHVQEQEQEEETTTTTANSTEDRLLSLRLYNGTNGDDVLDPTRVGLVAANEFNVQSPLQHITKDQVRQVSKHIGLPNWNYASSPCLRSRIAIGVHVSPHKLHRIEKGEQYVRKFFNVSTSDNMRVRILSQNRAMIEIDSQYVQQIIMNDVDNSSNLVVLPSSVSSYFQEELGFASVGIREFRSGSVAAGAAVTTTTKTATSAAPP